ncbi:YchJ family metal-binding protein [Acidovorax sp. NCPPB 3859]|nr:MULTISPECIES: YchJ family metal-binding protein [unclassified Acidovorax]MDA8451957.1 YchJ family metal-binding protein [Acidovorax sp. GBBC 3297]MDA8461446.1 YchJ family metal-binding protein [Acidovorax sp. GBBC 3333]MDA8466479.1 YchJ family metal-binding protein [Acidovorax sp. GBBC 3332]MDA8471515.1 YchJ family metal-binding protein [Acidovorax sp. GBBC 3299]WCM78208.1 YchJ family metal-binding protein [Acidovorax sp. GBBC 712]
MPMVAVSRLSSSPSECPCGRLSSRRTPLSYADCCGRYIDHWDTCPAPDAESLMRSRYTAFVQGNADYLCATWAAEHRPPSVAFEPGVRWLGLEVRSHRPLGEDRAEVEFVARQRDAGGRAHRLHERSRFVREGGRWFYVDGEFPRG